MATMTDADLPALVTFLKDRAHVPHFTISYLNGDLLFQALEKLRQSDHNFSFKKLSALTIKKTPHVQDIVIQLLAPLMPSLSSLNLRGNTIGATGAAAIAQSPHMAHLTSLQMSLSHFTKTKFLRFWNYPGLTLHMRKAIIEGLREERNKNYPS